MMPMMLPEISLNRVRASATVLDEVGGSTIRLSAMTVEAFVACGLCKFRDANMRSLSGLPFPMLNQNSMHTQTFNLSSPLNFCGEGSKDGRPSSLNLHDKMDCPKMAGILLTC